MALMLAEEVLAYIHFLFPYVVFAAYKADANAPFISLLQDLGAPSFSVFEKGNTSSGTNLQLFW
jgi:hypothetical protein